MWSIAALAADAAEDGDAQLAAEVLLKIAQAAENGERAGGVALVEFVEPQAEAGAR